MPKIFISYRRADKPTESILVAERLRDRYGKDSVLYDIESLHKGVDFQKEIEECLANCDVLLAVIGDRWLDAEFQDGPRKGQRRLGDPNDLVRIEIASALRRGIPLIPVLIGVEMRELASDLPSDLSDLPKMNSVTVRLGEGFRSDLKMLSRDVDKVLQLPPLSPKELLEVPVRPNGLRSFGKDDADFYLTLLPGRRKNGLPEILHFWKTRIEENAFTIGVIHGPSGCGKSSLIKAGLIPLLDGGSVHSIYVEASRNDTEASILAALPNGEELISSNMSLRDAVRQCTQSSSQKLLIVLDQFEQYLHSTCEDEQYELVEALQECKDGKVQCMVLVRDDFWTPLKRFMNRVHTPMVDGVNVTLVDLFPKQHAKKVLALLGTAYGCLPKSGRLKTQHDKFLNDAITELADGDFVICVRLAIFAQMMGQREWIPHTLEAVGGAKGVSMEFLDDALADETALNGDRRHKLAARNVLHALMVTAQ